MDRVAALGLGQRKLQLAAVEAVAAVAQPVGPGHERLALAADLGLAGADAVEDVDAAEPQHADRGADLGDDGARAAGAQLELPAGGRDRHGADGHAGPGGAVPAGYSCMGTSPADHAAITGSMIRQASSASSPRMDSIGSLLSICWMRWA